VGNELHTVVMLRSSASARAHRAHSGLLTLESLDIIGFHVTKSENTYRLANGNQIADPCSYIRNDGTEGSLGQFTCGMLGPGMARDLSVAANDAEFEMRRVG